MKSESSWPPASGLARTSGNCRSSCPPPPRGPQKPPRGTSTGLGGALVRVQHMWVYTQPTHGHAWQSDSTGFGGLTLAQGMHE